MHTAAPVASMATSMEARPNPKPGFVREPGKPRLAEAPASEEAHVAVAGDADVADVLSRLEHQAAESGRLTARVEALEQALRREREARRRLADTLQRERRAAEALNERALRAEAAHASAAEELERLRQGAAGADEQLQLAWSRLAKLEPEFAWKRRPLWRKLLRRPPAQ